MKQPTHKQLAYLVKKHALPYYYNDKGSTFKWHASIATLKQVQHLPSEFILPYIENGIEHGYLVPEFFNLLDEKTILDNKESYLRWLSFANNSYNKQSREHQLGMLITGQNLFSLIPDKNFSFVKTNIDITTLEFWKNLAYKKTDTMAMYSGVFSDLFENFQDLKNHEQFLESNLFGYFVNELVYIVYVKALQKISA